MWVVVIVSVYVCRRQVEHQHKTCAQCCYSFRLFRCPCVCRVSVSVKATHIRHAYTVPVVSVTMCAYLP